MTDAAFAEVFIEYASRRWQAATRAPAQCVAEVRDMREATALGAEWDELAENALEENPSFDRQIVRAGVDAFRDARPTRVLTLRLRGCGRLVGLIPFYTPRLIDASPVQHAQSALNLYQFNGVPLIDRQHADAAIKSFLRILALGGDVPRRWLLPHVQQDGAFAQKLRRHAEDFGLDVLVTRPYSRPILTRLPGGFGAHVETIIGRKRAKTLERGLRGLEAIGAVRFERATDPDLVARRIEDFLRIEHSGWKGARGTSFLARPADAAFARRAFAYGRPGFIKVDSLLLDEVPIAVSINIDNGGTLFTPKCAYDETYRRHAPGLVLEYLVIKEFYDSGDHDLMDASTTADGHVIAGLWTDTRPMGTLIIGPKGHGTRSIALAETAKSHARRYAKRFFGRDR